MYYVYMLLDPDTNIPFYIGKGMGKRARTHTCPSSLALISYKNSKIKEILSRNKTPIISYYLLDVSEETAFTCERALIAKYGRKDIGLGVLCNLTDGGDGSSGAVHSKESVAAMVEKKRGVKHTDQHKLKNALAQSGKVQSVESNNKRSATLAGMNAPKALIIDIYDATGTLRYTSMGNFIQTCRDNDLPCGALATSYRTGGEPIFKTKVGKKKYKNFRLWFAKIR